MVCFYLNNSLVLKTTTIKCKMWNVIIYNTVFNSFDRREEIYLVSFLSCGSVQLKNQISQLVQLFYVHFCQTSKLTLLMLFPLLQRLLQMEFAEFIRTAQVEGVTLYQANQLPIKGTLCVTGHHLILSSRDNHIEELWVICEHTVVECIRPLTVLTQVFSWFRLATDFYRFIYHLNFSWFLVSVTYSFFVFVSHVRSSCVMRSVNKARFWWIVTLLALVIWEIVLPSLEWKWQSWTGWIQRVRVILIA